MGQNQQNIAHIPDCVSKLNQLPGSYFNSYLTVLADHWMPPRFAYAWTFPTLTYNQSRSIKYSFINMTYPRTFWASPSPTPWIYSQYKFFQINLHLPSPNSLYKRAPSIPRCQTCLSSPSSPAAGGSGWMPRIWSVFCIKPRIRMLEPEF